MTTEPTPSRADALIREHRASMHPEVLRAWASDAVDELGRLQAENERLRADQAQAMSEASSLAMSLFRKHYSSDPDYASGAVKFGLCDDLRGVISQIDNMSTGLARAELEASKNARIHELEMQALDLASENSILKRAETDELEARKPLPPMEAIKLGMEAQQACSQHSTVTANWALAMTRFYEHRLCGIKEA